MSFYTVFFTQCNPLVFKDKKMQKSLPQLRAKTYECISISWDPYKGFQDLGLVYFI